MRMKVILLICSILVCSCSSHHSGRLVEERGVTGSPGTVPYRTGTVPYRNQGSDAKVAARKANALRKIAKFCGSDGYSVTREGSSSTASNMSEVDFRCGTVRTASAPAGTLAQSNDSDARSGMHLTPNPNVEAAPSDLYPR
jgi:hypothetical protein